MEQDDSTNSMPMEAVDSPHGGQAGDAVANEVLVAIRQIVQRITSHSKHLFRETGLTVPQQLVLKSIRDAGHSEVTSSQISRTIHLSPATLTGILDRLERSGWVVRERRSRDRRKICLSLTENGRERLTTLAPPLQVKFANRLMALEDSERERILDSLQQVVDLLEAGDIEATPILDAGDIRHEEP